MTHMSGLLGKQVLILHACSARPTVPARHVLQCLLGTSYSACSALLSACSALLSACSALPTRPAQRQTRGVTLCQDVRPHTYGSLTGKKLRGLGGTCQAQSSKTMQHQAKSCHAKIKQCEKKTVQNELLLQAVHTCTPCSNSIFSAQNRVKRLFSPPIPARMVGENARPTKKNWPRKKRMASWARQRQQITEAADGGARARTGADGAVVLNLRRGPGAYALLSRADGQLTRAGQHYYSHLGLRPPSKDFDYNQPLIREGPNDYILRQVLRVPGPRAGDHPWQAAQRAGYERRDWLPVNELGGATRHPAHLTEEQAAQRVRQQVEASLDPGGPMLQLSDETYFLDPEGHWVVSTQSTRYRNSRTEVETLLRQSVSEDVPSAFEDKPLCVPRQLAELLQLSVEEVCADFDAMLRHDWRRLGISAEEVREFCVWRNAPMRVLSSQGRTRQHNSKADWPPARPKQKQTTTATATSFSTSKPFCPKPKG